LVDSALPDATKHYYFKRTETWASASARMVKEMTQHFFKSRKWQYSSSNASQAATEPKSGNKVGLFQAAEHTNTHAHTGIFHTQKAKNDNTHFSHVSRKQTNGADGTYDIVQMLHQSLKVLFAKPPLLAIRTHWQLASSLVCFALVLVRWQNQVVQASSSNGMQLSTVHQTQYQET